MRTGFYLNGKKVAKATLQAKITKERLDRMVKEAEETFQEDPLTENGFFLGSIGNLVIKFG